MLGFYQKDAADVPAASEKKVKGAEAGAEPSRRDRGVKLSEAASLCRLLSHKREQAAPREAARQPAAQGSQRREAASGASSRRRKLQPPAAISAAPRAAPRAASGATRNGKSSLACVDSKVLPNQTGTGRLGCQVCSECGIGLTLNTRKRSSASLRFSKKKSVFQYTTRRSTANNNWRLRLSSVTLVSAR